jgi:glycosyltransferase involved in cell wall biosynthesis
MIQKKMKICWPTKVNPLVGNAYGYGFHNSMMRRHIQKYVEIDDENKADIFVQITPADHFIPIPGKFNVLFSMFEFNDLPQTYIDNLDKADLILVPCSFCKKLFEKYTNKPVEVCWEGVDPEIYRYHERKPTVPFRFLWVGAPNPRKGYQLILEAVKVCEQLKNIEIYIKTTVPKMNWIQTLVNVWKKRKEIFANEFRRQSFWRMLARIPTPQLADKVTRYGKHKNIVFDTRKLPIEDLLELYNSAHCFILPSFGEGWGLTLSEAMATGAPCVATSHTGTSDFFDDSVGYVIEHQIRTQELANYKLTTTGFAPDAQSMLDRMFEVMRDYKKALKKGRAASHRILQDFTWDRSAQRMHEILRRYEPCQSLQKQT